MLLKDGRRLSFTLQEELDFAQLERDFASVCSNPMRIGSGFFLCYLETTSNGMASDSCC